MRNLFGPTGFPALSRGVSPRQAAHARAVHLATHPADITHPGSLGFVMVALVVFLVVLFVAAAVVKAVVALCGHTITWRLSCVVALLLALLVVAALAH
jgi:hypothetical protein